MTTQFGNGPGQRPPPSRNPQVGDPDRGEAATNWIHPLGPPTILPPPSPKDMSPAERALRLATAYSLAAAVYALLGALVAAVIGGPLWVVIHFIRKFW